MHQSIQVFSAGAVDAAGGVTEVAVGALAVDVQHMVLERDERAGFVRTCADDRHQRGDVRFQAGHEPVEVPAACERLGRLPGLGAEPPGGRRLFVGNAGGRRHRGVQRRILQEG
ncbi:hypothetical protein [Mitsuaria sp. 7]|uniref:hypothetical protein n=1 Tax=Mitsuaria sp. 7 TaxID=1658665 RepID=UPI0018D37168|nr:hypothetical protein [Mitsuaria sp. 7]